MAVKLYDYQIAAVEKMQNGCILCGGVGSGKSRTALAYYYLQNGGEPSCLTGTEEYIPMEDPPKDLYIITTAMAGVDMQIEWKTRLCTVNDKLGYFHAWEHYSKPLEASPLIGGAPAGVFSKIFGIVEFSDGVRRVDPTDICFCDEENQMLSEMEKFENE